MNINIKLDKKAKSVVAKTANISGGDTPAGGVDISPLIMVKAGGKIKVDFSKVIVGLYSPNSLYIDSVTAKNDYFNTNQTYLGINLEKNEAETQFIVTLSDGAYQGIGNSVVLYEGNVSGLNDTLSIASELPTIEFTVNSNYEGITFITTDKAISN